METYTAPNPESLRAIWRLAIEKGILKAKPGALLERLEGMSADLFSDGSRVFQALMSGSPPKKERPGRAPAADLLRRIGDEFLRLDSRDAERTKKDGRYYTPVGVVDKILELVWPDIFPDGVLASRTRRTVCDPAMGCGYFFLRLVESAGTSFAAKAPELREWAGECLYGVDKDPASVFMARALLWLCLSDRDGEFVPGEKRFVCAEALLGDGFADSRRSRLDPLERRDSVDWDRAFPEVAAAGGFDVVVGNPPYEVLTNFRAHPDKKWLAEALRECGLYADALSGQINLYRCFIEQSLSLLKPGGVLSFVVPMSLARDLSAEQIRRHLITACAADRWRLYGEDEGVFPGVAQAACVFRARSGGGRAPTVFVSMGSNDAEPLATDELEEVTGGSLVLPCLDPEGLAALRWFWRRSFARLGETIDSHVGEVDQTFFRDCMSDDPTGCLLARGAHLSPFHVDVRDKPGKERYLLLDRFLEKKGAMAASCRERVAGRRVAQLGIRNMRTLPRLAAAILPEGVYAGNSLNIFYPSPAMTPEYLAGLLNSRILDWHFRIGSANNNINLHEMRMIPVPEPPSPGMAGAVEDAYLACERAAMAGDDGRLLHSRLSLDQAVAACFGMPEEHLDHILNLGHGSAGI